MQYYRYVIAFVSLAIIFIGFRTGNFYLAWAAIALSLAGQLIGGIINKRN